MRIRNVIITLWMLLLPILGQSQSSSSTNANMRGRGAAGAPSGTCTRFVSQYTNTSNLDVYDCPDGTYRLAIYGAGTVTSLTGTANEVSVSGATGAVTVSLPTTVSLASHTAFLPPAAAGSAPTAEGDVRFNTTNHRIVHGISGSSTGTVLDTADIAAITSPVDYSPTVYRASSPATVITTASAGTSGQALISAGSAAAPAYGALNLAGGSSIFTGNLPATNVAATPLPTPAATITLAAPRGYAICTTTCTVTVPVPAAGYEFCIRNTDNVATVITLAALGSSARYETTARTSYGTAGTGTAVSGGAVTDQICLVGLDATHYLTMSSTGSWTVN